MEGRKPMKTIDILLLTEKEIMQRIQKEIKDTANEEELYYYVFYLVHSFFQKTGIGSSGTLMSGYSTMSLNNYIKTSLNNPVNKTILESRSKRYEDYKIMWNQIELDEGDRSTRMAQFFGFASKYIYGNNMHMLTLTALYPELTSIISISIENLLSALGKRVDSKISGNKKTSFISKLKSFLK
tara:strand:- start:6 stop:554 length:549 start_codon:yes stop_codon:yes gene_type:complete